MGKETEESLWRVARYLADALTQTGRREEPCECDSLGEEEHCLSCMAASALAQLRSLEQVLPLNPFKPLTTDQLAALADFKSVLVYGRARGFDIEHNGGGCLSLDKELKNAGIFKLTYRDDPDLPHTLNSPVTLGFYVWSTNGSEMEGQFWANFETAKEAMNWANKLNQ